MAKPGEPRRLRWSVPRADESTNRWLDGQHDISRSLQLLIRESIQRDGYIDVVNRPVEQLPRRGRPPLSDSDLSAERTAAERPGAESSAAEATPAAKEDTRSAGAALPEHVEAPPEAAAEPDHRPEAATRQGTSTKGVPSGLDAFLTH